MVRFDLQDGELDGGLPVSELHRGLLEDSPPPA